MPVARFLALLRPHLRPLAFAAVLLLVAAPAPAAAIWLLQAALARLADGDAGQLLLVCAAFAGLYVLSGAAQVARTAATKGVAWTLASDLRRRLHRAFLDRAADGAVGDRLAALLDEADQVQYGVSAVVGLVRNPLQLVLLLGTALALAPGLLAVAGALLLPVGAAAVVAGGRVRRATVRSREARAALSSLAAEQLAAVDTVRAFGAEDGEAERFAAADRRDRARRWRLELERALPAAVVGALLAAALAGVVAVGGGQVADGALEPASLVAFVMALVLANRPLTDLAEAWSLLQRSLGALRRVEDELAMPVDRGLRVPAPAGRLAVRWAEVTVVRGGRAVVDGVCLEARPGELLALVGPTGAGKTTLLRAALGAVRPDLGRVTVGGVDAAQLAAGAVAIVPQDLVLLARTVAENVALGDEPADPSRVRAALAAAEASFADPERGLAEGGRGLSGGERQRLCLARALYRDARVILLDEPTGQLDTDTARAVVQTLRSLRPGRTLVVATHDPEVWERADRVAVVRDGALVAVGPPSTIARAIAAG